MSLDRRRSGKLGGRTPYSFGINRTPLLRVLSRENGCFAMEKKAINEEKF
jgi:hypothetical protein